MAAQKEPGTQLRHKECSKMFRVLCSFQILGHRLAFRAILRQLITRMAAPQMWELANRSRTWMNIWWLEQQAATIRLRNCSTAWWMSSFRISRSWHCPTLSACLSWKSSDTADSSSRRWRGRQDGHLPSTGWSTERMFSITQHCSRTCMTRQTGQPKKARKQKPHRSNESSSRSRAARILLCHSIEGSQMFLMTNLSWRLQKLGKRSS